MDFGKVSTMISYLIQAFNRQLGTTISLSTDTWVVKIDGLPDLLL